MSKPYCGTGDPPKGYRRGTVEECRDMKQIRYYGIKKINPKLLEKKNTVSRSQLMNKHTKLKVKVNKMIEDIKKETDQKKKDKMKVNAKKAYKELVEIDAVLQKMEKDRKKKIAKEKKEKAKKDKKEKAKKKKKV